MADAVALEADLDARVVECFGGAFGSLRRDDLVVGATADEGRRADSGVDVVFGGEIAVQRDDPPVGAGRSTSAERLVMVPWLILPAVILSIFLGDIRVDTVQNHVFRTGPLHVVTAGSMKPSRLTRSGLRS